MKSGLDDAAVKLAMERLSKQARDVIAGLENDREYAWHQRRDNAVERSIYAADRVIVAVTCLRTLGDPEVREVMRLCYEGAEP